MEAFNPECSSTCVQLSAADGLLLTSGAGQMLKPDDWYTAAHVMGCSWREDERLLHVNHFQLFLYVICQTDLCFVTETFYK